jgi:hypothetical protein
MGDCLKAKWLAIERDIERMGVLIPPKFLNKKSCEVAILQKLPNARGPQLHGALAFPAWTAT